MSDKEVLDKMQELDSKFKQMKKLAMKVATEMDSLVEEYASLLQVAKERNLVE